MSLNDTIKTLSEIGNQVAEGATRLTYNKPEYNWDVTKYTDKIGSIEFETTNLKNTTLSIYENPYSTKPMYTFTKKLVNGGNIELSGVPTITVPTTQINNHGYFSYKFNYGKNEYTYYNTPINTKEGYKCELISTSNSTGYSVNIYVPIQITGGNLPFYCWHVVDKSLWVGIHLLPNINGWIKAYDDTWTIAMTLNPFKNLTINGTTLTTTSNPLGNIKDNNNNNITPTEPMEKEKEEEVNWTYNDAWDNNVGGYDEALEEAEDKSMHKYWDQLYGAEMGSFSMKSHQSIIGLPLQFMKNVDMRIGSAMYGKQFMEDILYDMNIACIKPGGPILNPNLDEEAEYTDDFMTRGIKLLGKGKAYYDYIKKYGAGDTLKQWMFTLFKGKSARFYSFQSDYTHYTHYVNTLCHLFITYLNIGDKYYTTYSGTRKRYAFYSDDPAEIEKDGGLGLHTQFGWDNAVYMYYSPDSSLNHSFSNSTTQSSLNATLTEASSAVKEWGFFINAAGLESTGKAVTSFTQDLVANVQSGGGFLSRLFGNAAEGVSTILAGNNLSLPEIYSDSDTSVEHTFKIKLASPYGDPESVFLYVLRPLARLLAFSLPRQFGPNSYQSPFIIQAFSKGQFNCQLGIVTNLSITRCGNGGESHTIHHIPTELEVSLTIQDMYEKVFLSNEYFGNSAWGAITGAAVDALTGGWDNVGDGVGTLLAQSKMSLTATRLLFNNVGLIDFVASLCGANLNQATGQSGWTIIWNLMKNRTSEIIEYNENDGWKFNQWEKQLNDAYNDAAAKLSTTITTIA